MNARLNKNKPKLGIAILSVGLKMFTNGDCFFDEVPKILRYRWAKSMGLEDTEYFVTGDETDLRYAVRVSEGDTDL